MCNCGGLVPSSVIRNKRRSKKEPCAYELRFLYDLLAITNNRYVRSQISVYHVDCNRYKNYIDGVVKSL